MLYNLIYELRKALDLTQAEFAQKLGMTRNGIQRWEYKEVKIKEASLRLIETTFQVNPGWLRNGKGPLFSIQIASRLEPVVEWMKTLSEEQAERLLKDLKQNCNSFKKWLKENNS